MIVVAVFAVTNVNPVLVTYFFWEVESPLILVILFSVLMGGIITAAVGMVRMFKMKREIKQLRKENIKLKEELPEVDLQVSEENKDEVSSNEENMNTN